jgi:hypothetical protein
LSAAICALSALTAQSAAADEAAPTVKAVWRVQEFAFPYFGLTTIYACDTLREKIRIYMLDIGAREDVFVSRSGCVETNRPEKYPNVRITVAFAVEATDENRQAIAKDPKQQELQAKLAKKSKAQAAASDQPFDAAWRKAVLNSKVSASTGASGDCELIDQLRRDVLPKLGVKTIKNEINCTPYQGSVSNQKLEVEALAPVAAGKS